MRDDDLYNEAWMRLYEQARDSGFSSALAETFADQHAPELYRMKVANEMDRLVQVMQ